MKTREGFKRMVRMTVLAAALLPLTALAQAARLKMPDFSGLAGKATESVDIDLEGDTLKSAMGFMSGGNTNPQIAEQLKGLESISVKVFSFSEPGVYSTKDIESVVKQVESKGWKKLMSVREKDGRVEMWMREGNADGGMFFVSSEPKELVLINIAGKVDLAMLSKLQGKLGVPNLGLGGAAAPPAPPAPAAPAAPAPAAPAAPPAAPLLPVR